MVATIELKKFLDKLGIFQFQDTNGLLYFSLDETGENIIACPDGISAFTEIQVTEQLVICKTLQEETYRIYICDQKEWLTDIFNSNDFYGKNPVLNINENFIQSNTNDSPNEGSPIYLLKEKRWIPSALPHRDDKAGFFKSNIKQVTFHGKKALLLEYGEGYLKYSLYMIYFIKENIFFTIPTPEQFHKTSEESKSLCTFRFISETYAMFYYENSNTYELYDVIKMKYLKLSQFIDVKTSTDDQKSHMDSAYKIIDIAFDDTNLALEIRRGVSHESIMEWYVFEFKKNLQQVIATLEPTPVTRSYFDNVEFDETGKMKVSFITKQNLVKTL